MPLYVDKFPQDIEPIKTTTLAELVSILPEKIDYKLNVWLGDKLARYAVTTGNIVFIVEQDDEPSTEEKNYFNSLVEPLGITGTASNLWKTNIYSAIRIYNEGRLIVDKKTMKYKELPSVVKAPTLLTAAEIMKRMPVTIPWPYTFYLTGGIVRNGWSANDIDIMIFDEEAKEKLRDMKYFFQKELGHKVDVGQMIMPEREPIYLYKIYEKGKLCHS